MALLWDTAFSLSHHFFKAGILLLLTLLEYFRRGVLVYLLGLVSAHFDIAQKVEFSDEYLEEEYYESYKKGSVDINSGIAVVIPAQYIYELLMRDDFVEEREAAKARAQENLDIPTSDS